MPSKPVVSNTAANTNANQITIAFVAPTNTGGTPIIDYSIQMAVGTGQFNLIVSGHLSNTFTASNLITGSNYKFIVTAKNKVGLGENSDPV